MSTLSSDQMAWTDEQARHSPKLPPRCVRTLMNRVEILRMSNLYFPTLFDLGHCKPIIPEKDIGVSETHLAEC